jgi:hypothetical protein
MLTETEIGPSLHNNLTSIEAISAPIRPLNRIPDLMTQRLFEKVAGESGVFSPSPKCRPESMRRDRTAALRIHPPWLIRTIPIHILEQGQHCHIAEWLAGF